MKERANSKRGLQPKKERSGYQLLSSQEYQYIYKRDIVVKEATFNRPEITRTVTSKAFCFRTVIQSPFDAKLPILDVKLLFYKDLMKAPLKYLGVKDTHEFDESILSELPLPCGTVVPMEVASNSRDSYPFLTKRLAVRTNQGIFTYAAIPLTGIPFGFSLWNPYTSGAERNV